MAITKNDPNTIQLSRTGVQLLDELPAVEAITPGMLVELHDDSGTLSWGVHDSADGAVMRAVALERIELNDGVDDAYADGDMVKVGLFQRGSKFWGLIPSGQDITQGEYLQSNGDGKLKALGSGSAVGVAMESPGAVTEDTRVRVMVV